MEKGAPIGSERAQGAKPGSREHVPDWPIPLEEVELLSLTVSRQRKRNCQEGVLRKGIREWRLNQETFKFSSNLST